MAKVDDKQPAPHKCCQEGCLHAGRYASTVSIGYSSEMFVLDHLSTADNAGKHLVARIFVTPAHAKRIRNLLTRMLAQYQKDNPPNKEGE